MMVIIRVEDTNSNNSDSNQSKSSRKQSIFTCAELENRTFAKSSKEPKKVVPNLMLTDSAVMQFSSKSELIRYSKDEMEAFKQTKLARAPPACFYDQKIQQLKIWNEQKEEDREAQVKVFQSLISSNLSIEPKYEDLLNNYHRSLFPQYDFKNNNYNNPRSPRTINQNFNRRVSWGDQKQFINNQQKQTPSYDQKNFFDTITTTATSRPRMGVGSLGFQKNFQSSQVRSAKGNPCANERHSYYPNNLSVGSLSLNESKSSYDESMDKSDKPDSDSTFLSQKRSDFDEALEGEAPEWFTCPASRSDVIDLRGFEDEDEQSLNAPISENSEVDPQQVNPQQPGNFASYSYRRSSYNQHASRPTPSVINSSGSSYYHPRYRNPLHNSRSSNGSVGSFYQSDPHNVSMISQEMEGKKMHPFFEMWKNKNVPLENNSFMNWMNSNHSMKKISDIENALKRSRASYQNQQQQQQLVNPTLQQFFQFASTSGFAAPQVHQPAPTPYGFENFQPGTAPTPEQLQQHTSEIMRNAIMRKHFGEDRKFPK